MRNKPRKAIYAGTFRPGSPFIHTLDNTTVSMDEIVERAADTYVRTIQSMKVYIDEALTPLYGRALNIPESSLSDVVDKIRTIKNETGKTLVEMGQHIRKYLGFECSFYRKSGDKQIPVDSSRLFKAYNAVIKGEDKNIIKAYLYF